MKWIRWDGSDFFDFQNNKPAEGSEDCDQCLKEEYVVCEKHDDWREIESGTLNLEDGKLHITLKPLPESEKLPTIIDLVNLYFETVWGKGYRDAIKGWGNSPLSIVTKRLVEAIDREEEKSANPYTKEAVDGFIDTISKYPCWLNDSQPGAYWSPEGRSAWDKLQALFRQREAANVT